MGDNIANYHHVTDAAIELHGISEAQQQPTKDGSMVDVDAAVAEFNSLEREIKFEQRRENVESQGGATEFDIQEFFDDSVRKADQTGHKLKRMGVIVKNLTVVGMGADADTIPDNLDILKALWPPTWYEEIES